MISTIGFMNELPVYLAIEGFMRSGYVQQPEKRYI